MNSTKKMLRSAMLGAGLYVLSGAYILLMSNFFVNDRRPMFLCSIFFFMAGFRARDAYNAWKLTKNDEPDEPVI